MNTSASFQASVLATVLVVAVLMLLSTLAVIALWEADFLLFARIGHQKQQRANLESAFVLYENDSTLMSRLDADSTVQLFDSLPGSKVKITVQPWGLYEVVSVTADDPGIHTSQIVGNAVPSTYSCNLYYRNDRRSVSVAGKTNLKGKLLIPYDDIQYGQIESVFFCGERIEKEQLGHSDTAFPASRPSATEEVRRLLDLLGNRTLPRLDTDQAVRAFYDQPALILQTDSEVLSSVSLKGNVILVGKNLFIENTCRLDHAIVVARNIYLSEGFSGSAQFFATDTIIVEKDVVLTYPSGIFLSGRNPARYAELMPGSEVNGYVIVSGEGEPDIEKPNYKQAVSAILRGLLYVDGVAQLQGIVSGSAYLNCTALYSPQGYYRDLFYNTTLLENPEYAYPLWMTAPHRPKTAVCVY